MFRGMYRGSGQGGGGSVDYNRVVEKIATIPTASAAVAGKIYLYTGANGTYHHGYIYECVPTYTDTAVVFGSANITWALNDFLGWLTQAGVAYNQATHGIMSYEASGNLWTVVGLDANGLEVFTWKEYTEDLEDGGCVFATEPQDGDSSTFTFTTTVSGYVWARLDVQPASGSGGGAVDSVNGQTGAVVLDAEDVGALADSTKYAASVAWSINSSTYVMTLQLKDQDGNNLGTAQTIDLPLESVVVSGSYDSVNKKIVLTLQSGSTIDVPVADLVSGLQTEITSQNKLDADLVDDSTSTNKFVSTSEKSTWNGKQDAINDLNDIRSGASAGATAVQPSSLATVATTGAYSDLSGTPTIPTVGDGTITITQGGTTKGTFTTNQSGDTTIDIDAGGSSLPSQTGQSGKFLTTDGTDASWGTVDALPSQTGHNGEMLTTNGTNASWTTPTTITFRTWGANE